MCTPICGWPRAKTRCGLLPPGLPSTRQMPSCSASPPSSRKQEHRCARRVAQRLGRLWGSQGGQRHRRREQCLAAAPSAPPSLPPGSPNPTPPAPAGALSQPTTQRVPLYTSILSNALSTMTVDADAAGGLKGVAGWGWSRDSPPWGVERPVPDTASGAGELLSRRAALLSSLLQGRCISRDGRAARARSGGRSRRQAALACCPPSARSTMSPALPTALPGWTAQ